MSPVMQVKATGMISLVWSVSHLELIDTYSIEMHKDSIARFEWPHGSYWTNEHAAAKANGVVGH